MVSNREYIQNLMDFQNHYCISKAHFFASLHTQTILESNHPLPIYTLAYRTMNLYFSAQTHKQVACSAKSPGSKLFDFVVSSYLLFFFFSSLSGTSKPPYPYFFPFHLYFLYQIFQTPSNYVMFQSKCQTYPQFHGVFHKTESRCHSNHPREIINCI